MSTRGPSRRSVLPMTTPSLCAVGSPRAVPEQEGPAGRGIRPVVDVQVGAGGVAADTFKEEVADRHEVFDHLSEGGSRRTNASCIHTAKRTGHDAGFRCGKGCIQRHTESPWPPFWVTARRAEGRPSDRPCAVGGTCPLSCIRLSAPRRDKQPPNRKEDDM